MSLTVEHARSIIEALGVEPIPNFISQAKAKQLLQEVHELSDNFPAFTEGLDVRATFIAYRMLNAGCSLLEQDQGDEGHQQLHAAGDLLESTHRASAQADSVSGFHCLIGAMAFYACGHYSRAFVLIGTTESSTVVGGIVASFLRKDFAGLIHRINDVLLQEEIPGDEDVVDANKWALEILITRSIALTLEHAISGDSEYVAEADKILADAMIISEAGANPSFWWIARILRLMFKDYEQGSLWTCLPPFFGPDGRTEVRDYASLLALSKPPVTELWRSQLLSLQLALNNENSGGVVNLRTSAGKTRVAELAILKELRANTAAKILYLAPFRSLAFELERTFSKFLGALGYSVSHLYGGSRFSGVDRDLVDEANLLIATPEKAKAMLRAAPELFGNVRLIVIDEGHLLGSSERDVRNELFLEHLRVLAHSQSCRMLLLSAVLPNASQLAEWIGDSPEAVAQSTWKPSDERYGVLSWFKRGVEIEWRGGSRCFNPNFVEFRDVLEPGKKKARRYPRTKTEAVAASAVRLSEIGPVLIFAAQARWVPSMARAVLLGIGANEAAHVWPVSEWKLFEALCLEELGESSLVLKAARRGVVCHSNRLPSQVRMALEKLMAAGTPRVIVATTTLGQGVNVGVSSVIIAQTLIGKKQRIGRRDFWNICGRAGRAFVDGEGKVLFAVDATKPPGNVETQRFIAETYFEAGVFEKVSSGLLRVIRQLKQTAEEAGVSFEVFLELVANNDISSLGEQAADAHSLTDLIDDQLLALHANYQGIDPSGDQVDWIEDAFRKSLAVIQAYANNPAESEDAVALLKARTTGILKEVPTPQGRQSIITSGLPMSVGKAAFRDLNTFRGWVDGYLAGGQTIDETANLVMNFEEWARENGAAVCESIEDKEILDEIRPMWLGGESLLKIRESSGPKADSVCSRFYCFELSWILHSVAQKLDPDTGEERKEMLALISLLLELGLPDQASARIFLAGIRSRAAAVELGRFVSDPTASPSRLRRSLLDKETSARLREVVTPETVTWLDLLADEQASDSEALPMFSDFTLKAPPNVRVLHSRKIPERETAFLCSTDGRFVFKAKSTDEFPFHSVANDPRFVFQRSGAVWSLHSRDPRMRPAEPTFEDLFVW